MAQPQRDKKPRQQPQPKAETAAGRTRAATDRGLTGDKVAATDPAAAPLETDAETAATPTPGAAAEASLRTQESAARPGLDRQPAYARDAQPRGRDRRVTVTLAVAAAVLVIVGVLIALF